MNTITGNPRLFRAVDCRYGRRGFFRLVRLGACVQDSGKLVHIVLYFLHKF